MSSKDRAAKLQGDGLGCVCRAASPSLLSPSDPTQQVPVPFLALRQGDECQEFRKQHGQRLELGRLIDVAMLTVNYVHSLAKHPSRHRMRNRAKIRQQPAVI